MAAMLSHLIAQPLYAAPTVPDPYARLAHALAEEGGDRRKSSGGFPNMPGKSVPGMPGGDGVTAGPGPVGGYDAATGAGYQGIDPYGMSMGGGSFGPTGAGELGLASGGGDAGGVAAATGGGAGGGGAGAGLGAFALPAAFAAAIGVGKNTEANHAGTPVGDMLLGGLAPSGAQIAKDPIGMGLPTLLGAPFLTPFTASDEAKKTKPEWSSLFGIGL